MTNELTEVNLGVAGLEFLLSQLELGATFSKCLLERAPITGGEVVTHLPAGVPAEAASRFKEGGKLPTPPETEWRRTEGAILVPTPTTRDHLVRLIAGELERPATLCILENPDSEPRDGWLEGTRLRTAFLGNEVYHLLLDRSTPSEIDEAIRQAQALWLFVGAIVKARERLPLLPENRGEFTLGALCALAEQADLIFAGAYDGEGYVIWRRRC